MVLGARWFYGGLGCRGQKTTLVQETSGLFGLAAEGGKDKNHAFLEKVSFVGRGTSGRQKKHLANKKVSGSLEGVNSEFRIATKWP